MKMNTQKRIFKGVILSLVLCAVVFSLFPSSAFASAEISIYAEVIISRVNVRSGPGLNYDVVTQYPRGYRFYANEGDYIYADGYKWYSTSDGFVAQAGGLKFVDTTTFYDCITGYDIYGSARWEHTCIGTGNPNWGYHITVDQEGYLVNCDCGWGEYYALGHFLIGSDGDFTEFVFLGLDTDNDERVDLYPGQTKFLPNRANSSASTDLRPYQILEFFDDPDKDIPSVTLVFRDEDNKPIAQYTFNWSVSVHVEDYGVVMVGHDGLKKIHYVDGEFLLYDRRLELHLADVPREYTVFHKFEDGLIVDKDKHLAYHFTLAPVGAGDWGLVEWVVHITRSVCDFVANLFDFFNLGFIFSQEDSPFHFLVGG